jgi:hypothetical protein
MVAPLPLNLARSFKVLIATDLTRMSGRQAASATTCLPQVGNACYFSVQTGVVSASRLTISRQFAMLVLVWEMVIFIITEAEHNKKRCGARVGEMYRHIGLFAIGCMKR